MSVSSSAWDPSRGSLSSAYSTFNLDRGRLSINIPLSPLHQRHEDLLKQASRIEEALKEKKIFVHTVDVNPTLVCCHIPLKNNDKESSTKTLKSALEALKNRSIVDAVVQKEVLAIFEALHEYSSSTSAGIDPPDLSNMKDYQSAVKNWWDKYVRGMPFRPIPKPYQNLVLYDAYRNDPALNPSGKFHQQLSEVACTKDFFKTPANINLLRQLPFEGLIFKGPEGLNPIDQALRHRNAALIRAIMGNAESDWINFNDTRKLRSVLNSILLEIETGSQTSKPVENSGVDYSRFLKEKGLTRNLSDEDQRTLDLNLDKLVSSAVEVSAFLLLALSPGGVVTASLMKGVFQNDVQPHHIWLHINLNSVQEGGIVMGVFESFILYSWLDKTINALIIDRILKLIIKADPSIAEEIRAQIFEISEAAPFQSILNKARLIASEPSSDLLEIFRWQTTSLLRQFPGIAHVNQILGQQFTKDYGSKWRLRESSNVTRGALVADQLELEGFIANEDDKEWFNRRLKKAGLKNYGFIKFPKNMFRLSIVLPDDFQASSTHSSHDDQECPRLLSEWALNYHVDVMTNSAGAQASDTSSTSTSHASTTHHSQGRSTRSNSSKSHDLERIKFATSQFSKVNNIVKKGVTQEDIRNAKELLDSFINLSTRSSSSSSTSQGSAPSTPAEFTSEQKAGLARGYLKKAETYLAQNEDIKAMRVLDALIALNPEDKFVMGKALYLKASNQYKKKQSQEAIDIYERLFKESNLEEPVLSQAHFECGNAYHALHQLDNASRHYGIVINQNSADLKVKAEALMKRAAIFEKRGDYLAALNDRDEAVKIGQAGGFAIENLQEQFSNLNNAANVQATCSTITDR